MRRDASDTVYLENLQRLRQFGNVTIKVKERPRANQMLQCGARFHDVDLVPRKLFPVKGNVQLSGPRESGTHFA